MSGNEISLYIHVPFCTKKCHYCHFFVVPHEPNLVENYLSALKKEIALRSPFFEGKKTLSLYFGGGTPSLLEPDQLKSILDLLPEAQEITLEMNPEKVSRSRLEDFLTLGINRLSIGVQSLDDSELHLLSRTHLAKDAIHTIHTAAEVGFNNISIDLMYDVPSQTLASWTKTLEKAAQLPIQHLSLYNLTIEPHTVFYKQKTQLEKRRPLEEEAVEMLVRAVDTFEKAGLARYEISAFAKEGFRSLHNSGYWEGRPFLGLGPAAYSYWDKSRFCNHAHLKRYCEDVDQGKFPLSFSEQLSPQAHTKELLAIRLRLLEGAHLTQFELDQEGHATIAQLIQWDLLELHGTLLAMTERGKLFYDTIASSLIDA